MTTELKTSSFQKRNPKIFLQHVSHGEWTEYFLTASIRECSPREWTESLQHFCNANGAVLISGDAFGSENFLKTVREEAVKATSLECPWSYLAGRFSPSSSEGGYLAHAISGIPIKPLCCGDQIVGCSFEDSLATYAHLTNISPATTSANEESQTETVFAMIEDSLKQVGMNFHHVARTWFYMNRILDWYNGFNRVRTAFFESHKIFGGIMPASTGVGAANLSGAALLAKAYAILPKSKSIKVGAVDSPLQCDAYKYGSAFSRALEIEDASSRSLFISGTASIEPGGKTIHLGDVSKQIDLTLQVVEAILKSRSMSWKDTVHSIAYFRNEADVRLWPELVGDASKIPCVATQCDVCRDDLLFEIELQACRQT